MQQQTHISYGPYQKKAFQAFFTDADEIRFLMAKLLGDVTGELVLEPCAGQGAFIEALIGTPSRLEAIDIDEKHVAYLNDNMPAWVKVSHRDFIDTFVRKRIFSQEFFIEKYDSIICNPPYGLKFSIEYRKEIKNLYPSLYARESYGLFLYFGISALKEGGRYVFIVPDTFLTSINHKYIRQFLCEEAAPSHIIQFKSSRFETVNFAYGNFCVISGLKRPLAREDQVNWVNAIHSKESLEKNLLENKAFVSGEKLIQSVSTSWIHPG